jgi:hypothetical protein
MLESPRLTTIPYKTLYYQIPVQKDQVCGLCLDPFDEEMPAFAHPGRNGKLHPKHFTCSLSLENFYEICCNCKEPLPGKIFKENLLKEEILKKKKSFVKGCASWISGSLVSFIPEVHSFLTSKIVSVGFYIGLLPRINRITQSYLFNVTCLLENQEYATAAVAFALGILLVNAQKTNSTGRAAVIGMLFSTLLSHVNVEPSHAFFCSLGVGLFYQGIGNFKKEITKEIHDLVLQMDSEILEDFIV